MAVTIKGFGSDWSVPEPAKTSLGNLYASLDAQGRQPVRKGELFTNVRDHGVAGDGTTDDTAAIQALIDATTATGGVLFFPAGTYRITTLNLKSGVQLQGTNKMFGYGPQSKGATVFRPFNGSTGWMIDVTAGLTAVTGIDLRGTYNAATAPAGGIRANGSWARFSDLHFDGFAGPALQINGGVGNVVDNILAINSCLNRAVTANTAVMDIGGNDHFLSRVESSASLSGAVSSPNLYVNAWLVRGTNIFVSNCVGEFADRGFLVTGAKNRFTGVRADRNLGGGFEITGTSNTFASCMAIDNSTGVTNTYPAFKTTGNRNSFAACIVSYLPEALPTYAFEDTANNGDPLYRNTYTGCTGQGVQGIFKGHDYLGSSFGNPNHAVRVTSGATVPVGNSDYYVFAHSAATTVTDFTGGHSGQTITVLPLNGNTTIAHGTPIRTRTKRSTVLQAETVYTFTRYNGIWYEVPGSSLMLVSPNGTRYRLTVGDDGVLGTSTTG